MAAQLDRKLAVCDRQFSFIAFQQIGFYGAAVSGNGDRQRAGSSRAFPQAQTEIPPAATINGDVTLRLKFAADAPCHPLACARNE